MQNDEFLQGDFNRKVRGGCKEKQRIAKLRLK
jgi:hypothetical protein